MLRLSEASWTSLQSANTQHIRQPSKDCRSVYLMHKWLQSHDEAQPRSGELLSNKYILFEDTEFWVGLLCFNS